jgi:hypothetical protein
MGADAAAESDCGAEFPASETVVAFAGVAGRPGFRFPGCIGFIDEPGVKVGKLDSIAIVARLMDVTPLMPGLDLLNWDAGVEPVFGTPDMFVPEFDIPGIGFVMTGIGFVMTGIGFIMPPMPDIPVAMDSRSLRSSVSTEIVDFRRVFRAIILRRPCSACDLIGLILREKCTRTCAPT